MTTRLNGEGPSVSFGLVRRRVYIVSSRFFLNTQPQLYGELYIKCADIINEKLLERLFLQKQIPNVTKHHPQVATSINPDEI